LERTRRGMQRISLARCLNNTHKLLVPALSDADESITSERGSAAGESSDHELACTDLLEATLAMDPAVASALQAFTATQKWCKDSRSKLKWGVKKDATNITGNRVVCKMTGKASISHHCKARSQPNPTACPSPATATGVLVPAIGSATEAAQAPSVAHARQQGMHGQFWCPLCQSVQSLVATPDGHECQACCDFVGAYD
jgi:hypothetical protein